MDGDDPLDPLTDAAPPDDVAPPPAARRRAWPWLAGLAIVAVLIAVVAIGRRPAPSTLTPAEINSTVSSVVAKGIAAAKAAPADSTVAYQTIQPSVVFIEADRPGTGEAGTSTGAGVIVNAQGAILTARHVVANATAIKISYADGTKANAKVATDDPAHDIAVLAADTPPSVIVPAVLGGGARVGDEAFAVGHPLGLVDSLSAGVISGLNRSIPIAGGTLNGLIQFDAAVNPGSSGGPLLNRSGQVIGIVTALANPSQQGFFIGIGFAVPIGTASGAAGGPEQ